MKKLHSFAFYALVTPVITLGAGSVLAQQSTDQDAKHSTSSTKQTHQSAQGAKQSDSQAAADRRNMGDQSRMENRDYMASVPANAMQASTLIGTKVRTTIDKDVGSVKDLIIDENGQIVAIVVGVGGFLAMGEKDVAIGWDHVTKSGTADEQELQIDVTREDLRSAPEFEKQD